MTRCPHIVLVWRGAKARWEIMARACEYIRGHELPAVIVTFDGFMLPYGELGL